MGLALKAAAFRSAEQARSAIRFIADDSTEIAPTSAGEFKRRTGEIIVRERFRPNPFVRNHEIGHLLLDGVQSLTWASAFEDDPVAWDEFLSLSVATSYQKRDRIHSDWISKPMAYDWVEIGPDLYMLDQADHLSEAPGVVRILERIITANFEDAVTSSPLGR